MSSTNSAPPTQCKICDREFKSPRALSSHLQLAHKITSKEYYDSHLKQEAEGACFACGSQTRFRKLTTGYRKFCSHKCSANDLETIELRQALRFKTLTKNPSIRLKADLKRKQTLRDNPEIMLNSIKKRTDTLRLSPDIVKNAGIKISEIFKNNPHIIEQANKKRAETLADNPQIELDRVQNIRHTLSLSETKAKISIGLREYYANLRHNSSATQCSVYLVAHESLDIVKIGITTNMQKRIKEIKRDFGQVSIIKERKTTYAIASSLELEMHKYFKSHCEVQPKTGAHRGGRTEWFSSCILDEAVQMMD